ncbi:MAG: DivIVA domain-containing protein [Actinomycetales bacterium]|jgi:DivIVA domain-containing protein
MALTPADIRSVQFSTTRLKTGYEMDEVDAFLDRIETELGTLISQTQAARDGEAVLRAQCDQLVGRVSELERRLSEAATMAAPRSVPTPITIDTGQGSDAARQAADQIVSAARAEAASIRARVIADLRAGIAAVEGLG